MYYIRISKIALATLLLLASACKDESKNNNVQTESSKTEQLKETEIIVDTADVPKKEVIVADVPQFIPPPAPVGFGDNFIDRVGFNSDDESNADIGTVGFRDPTTQLWYTVNTPAFPDFALLSSNRNVAALQGDLAHNDSGFLIEESGSYAVSFNAVVFADDDDDISGLNVFLLARAPDDVSTTIDTFDVTRQVGTISEIPYNTFVTLHGSGILQNLTRGDYLSLVTNNIEGSTQDVVVVAWTISVQRIYNDQPINFDIPLLNNITGNPFPTDFATPTEPAKETEAPIEAPAENPTKNSEEFVAPTEGETAQPEVTTPNLEPATEISNS